MAAVAFRESESSGVAGNEDHALADGMTDCMGKLVAQTVTRLLASGECLGINNLREEMQALSSRVTAAESSVVEAVAGDLCALQQDIMELRIGLETVQADASEMGRNLQQSLAAASQPMARQRNRSTSPHTRRSRRSSSCHRGKSDEEASLGAPDLLADYSFAQLRKSIGLVASPLRQRLPFQEPDHAASAADLGSLCSQMDISADTNCSPRNGRSRPQPCQDFLMPLPPHSSLVCSMVQLEEQVRELTAQNDQRHAELIIKHMKLQSELASQIPVHASRLAHLERYGSASTFVQSTSSLVSKQASVAFLPKGPADEAAEVQMMEHSTDDSGLSFDHSRLIRDLREEKEQVNDLLDISRSLKLDMIGMMHGFTVDKELAEKESCQARDCLKELHQEVGKTLTDLSDVRKEFMSTASKLMCDSDLSNRIEAIRSLSAEELGNLRDMATCAAQLASRSSRAGRTPSPPRAVIPVNQLGGTAALLRTRTASPLARTTMRMSVGMDNRNLSSSPVVTQLLPSPPAENAHGPRACVSPRRVHNMHPLKVPRHSPYAPNLAVVTTGANTTACPAPACPDLDASARNGAFSAPFNNVEASSFPPWASAAPSGLTPASDFRSVQSLVARAGVPPAAVRALSTESTSGLSGSMRVLAGMVAADGQRGIGGPPMSPMCCQRHRLSSMSPASLCRQMDHRPTMLIVPPPPMVRPPLTDR